MELLMAIALLCQAPGDRFSTADSFRWNQLKCQKWYVGCYESHTGGPYYSNTNGDTVALSKCIKERSL